MVSSNRSEGWELWTDMSQEGSLDWETQDAQSLAKWGVDYFKYDNCYHMGRMGTAQISFNRYKVMWDALNATGHPILYSLCSWGEDFVHTVSITKFLLIQYPAALADSYISGGCQLRTRGEYLEISTILSLARMTYAPAQIQLIHIVSLREATVLW